MIYVEFAGHRRGGALGRCNRPGSPPMADGNAEEHCRVREVSEKTKKSKTVFDLQCKRCERQIGTSVIVKF